MQIKEKQKYFPYSPWCSPAWPGVSGYHQAPSPDITIESLATEMVLKFVFNREESAGRTEEVALTVDKALATKRSKQNKNRRLKNGRQVS